MLNTSRNQLLFIAELNGYKEGTVEGKVDFGMQCYANHVVPDLDLDTEAGRNNNYEVIWLERIYEELDIVHEVSTPISRHLALELEVISDTTQWTVPIEVDVTASMLTVMGALMGSKSLLNMTNCIVTDDVLDDAWALEGVPRSAVKGVMTPKLYGSSKQAYDLLMKTGDYTMDECTKYANLINGSRSYALADMFKSYIIKHANMKPHMVLDTYFEEFKVSCNRHKAVGEYTKYYKAFDTASGMEKVFRNVHTKKVPDLKRFKSYSVTGLVHNLDSIVANDVSDKLYDKYGWVIDIYDAFVIPPQAAEDCRKWVAEGIDRIYANRNNILTAYFSSLGINSMSAHKDWEVLKSHIDKVDESFKCSKHLVK